MTPTSLSRTPAISNSFSIPLRVRDSGVLLYLLKHPLSLSQVVFEGVRGKGYRGDIALDDIKIKSGFCPPLKECTFEPSDRCGWTDEPNSLDDFDWTRQSGSTASSGTGPAFDHTFGTSKGMYMYIETSSQKAGDKARLLSPRYSATTGKCLRFWYHMYGTGIGTLNVRIKRTVFGRPMYHLQWSRTGNHGNIWRVAQVRAPWSYGYGWIRKFRMFGK